jgi:hypothetical protein
MVPARPRVTGRVDALGDDGRAKLVRVTPRAAAAARGGRPDHRQHRSRLAAAARHRRATARRIALEALHEVIWPPRVVSAVGR